MADAQRAPGRSTSASRSRDAVLRKQAGLSDAVDSSLTGGVDWPLTGLRLALTGNAGIRSQLSRNYIQTINKYTKIQI